MNVIINLNDKARVRLTEAGRNRIEKKYKELGLKDGDLKAAGLKDEYYETTVWGLMNDFGEEMVMGNNEMMFEGLEIEIIGMR